MTERPHHPSRRMRGFEAAASLMAAHIRRAGEGRGIGVARILTDWPAVVGPATAATCTPVRMSYGKAGLGGTLVLLTTGAHAPRLAMELPRIREQVNACYGWNAVARITITQTAPGTLADGLAGGLAGGLAEAQAPFAPAPRGAGGSSPAATARATAASAGVEDAGLAQALHRLGLNYQIRRDASSKGMPS